MAKHNDNQGQPSDKQNDYKNGAELDAHLNQLKSWLQTSHHRKPLYNPYKGKKVIDHQPDQLDHKDSNKQVDEKSNQPPSETWSSPTEKIKTSSQPSSYKRHESDESLKRHLVRQRWLAEQSKQEASNQTIDQTKLPIDTARTAVDEEKPPSDPSKSNVSQPLNKTKETKSPIEVRSSESKQVHTKISGEDQSSDNDKNTDSQEKFDFTRIEPSSNQRKSKEDSKINEDDRTDTIEDTMASDTADDVSNSDETSSVFIPPLSPLDEEFTVPQSEAEESSSWLAGATTDLVAWWNQWKRRKREEKTQDPTRSKKNNHVFTELETSEKVRFSFDVFIGVVGTLLRYLFISVLLGGVLLAGIGVGYFTYLVRDTDPPSQETMAQQLHQYDQQSTLYYASGEPIADVRTDLVRSVASLDEVSNQIIQGFIATEDEYFYEHHGIVPKAILRATLETLLTGEGTGGSTITQQLVKQQMLTNDVTFFRKANEIMLAMRVEQYFDKDEILTAYLNVSPFGRNNRGENIAGIGEAAQGIFGKSPNEVNLNQAAFLAGLPQDPYTYTPYDQNGQLRENLQPGIDRMHEVLFRMYRAQYITREEYESALHYDITQDFLPTQPTQEQRQTYLYQAIMHGAIEKLMRINIENDQVDWKLVWADDEWYNEYYFEAEDELRTGGYHVYSTIDKEIYDQLQTSAQTYNDELGVTYDGIYTDPDTGEQTYYVEPVQTGLVVIDNQTGRVLGFVAGTDYENNQIDHAFQMRRSPGSTIKPMAVYGPAIEHNIVTPATMIPDTSYIQEFPDGSTWAPTNYGQAVSGELMSTRRALLRSDNLPAVRIYEEVLRQGIPVINYLEKMGFNTIDSYTEEDTQNLAFSLGGVTTGPTVFEETRGFTTFANNGQYIDGYYIEKIEDSYGNPIFVQDKEPVRVFSEDTNYLMVDMLRDTMTEGTGRTANENLNVPGDWIAKTGISENSKDIWVLASTPAITIGSWIGYDSRYADYTIDVNDGFGLESVRSQIYWARIVNDLYAIRPEIFGTDLTFQQPESVITQQVLEQTGTLPGTIQMDNRTISLTGPLKEDVFKASNPAPPLTYDFVFAASPEDLQAFWGRLIQAQDEQRRQERDESSEDSDDENEDNQGEPNETPSETEDEAGESEIQPDDPPTEE